MPENVIKVSLIQKQVHHLSDTPHIKSYMVVLNLLFKQLQPHCTQQMNCQWWHWEWQLRIAKLKFTHNFIVCDRLPDTEIIFGIDVQKKFSLLCAWDKEKNCYIQKDGRFLTYTWNHDQKVTIGIVKSTLKIPPRLNGIIPIKIKGNSITDETVCFISNQESRNVRIPTSTLWVENHNIKSRTTVNILVSNYSNKHVTFSKGEYVGHLDNINEEDNSQPHYHSDAYTTSSVTTKRMMSEQVELDHLTINSSQTSKISLKPFWKSMNHSLHEMKLILEQHPSQKCP